MILSIDFNSFFWGDSIMVDIQANSIQNNWKWLDFKEVRL
jgi:hypothetical protein